jgi:ribosomal protein S18 acetylase RimI-like enzyme
VVGSVSSTGSAHGAIALYRKYGFEQEGLRRRQIRRSTGEAWDLLDMGLLLSSE